MESLGHLKFGSSTYKVTRLHHIFWCPTLSLAYLFIPFPENYRYTLLL